MFFIPTIPNDSPSDALCSWMREIVSKQLLAMEETVSSRSLLRYSQQYTKLQTAFAGSLHVNMNSLPEKQIP